MKKPANELHNSQLVVLITPTMRQAVDDQAFGQRISRGEVVRRALHAYLSEESEAK